MDPITRQAVVAAAGAAGGEALYVDDVFSTYLYEGNSSTQTITNGIDLSGEGGLVWIKGRDQTTNHFLQDTERGANNYLITNQTAPEATLSIGMVFNSDGFTQNNSFGALNGSGYSYASWTFRKAPGFFDVVTYTGTGVNRTVAHSLGSVPGTIIVKRTDAYTDWQVYHRSLANDEYLVLGSTAAKATGTTRWNSTTPTSTVFSLGTDATVNASGGTYVAYIFAHDDQSFGTNEDESIIKCGSYTGNGSTSGPVVDLGWEPQWLLIKGANASVDAPWFLYDNMRGIATNGNDAMLSADDSDAEFAGQDRYDLTSTGFKPTTNALNVNESGKTYIYMAIRRPHKPPTAATEVFDLKFQNSANPNILAVTPTVIDLVVHRQTNSSSTTTKVGDRVRGKYSLETSSVSPESGDNNYAFDLNSAVQASFYSPGNPQVNYTFRRAPGFFDVVAYTGDGSATRQISHNLGATPELIIVKSRSNTSYWLVWTTSFTLSSGEYIMLNQSSAKQQSNPPIFTTSAPTSTYFNVSYDSGLNAVFVTNASSYTYIAYLFATLDGISKVGTYTGTGSNVDVDCGFTAGARFVLIKRTDSTGDWYVWDTERGIVSGNDSYLLLNSTAAEVTTTDYIDPLNAGFTVTSSAPAALNASGGSYLFLAIA